MYTHVVPGLLVARSHVFGDLKDAGKEVRDFGLEGFCVDLHHGFHDGFEGHSLLSLALPTYGIGGF